MDIYINLRLNYSSKVNAIFLNVALLLFLHDLLNFFDYFLGDRVLVSHSPRVALECYIISLSKKNASPDGENLAGAKTNLEGVKG